MPIIRGLAPPTYFEYEAEDGRHYLANNSGKIITRAEWEALKDRIDSFFATNPDDEIAEVNAEKEWSYQEKQTEPEPKPKPHREGYIYLIHGEGTPWYKIGQTINPLRRIRELGTQGPFKYRMITCFLVDDMDGVENFLHTHHEKARVEGEWFLLTEDDVNELCQFKPVKRYTFFDIAKGFGYKTVEEFMKDL